MRWFLPAGIALLAGCAAAPAPTPQSAPPRAPEPSATGEPVPAEQPDSVPGLPSAPAECATFVAHAAEPPQCGSGKAADHATLARALELGDVAQRDANLAQLEPCSTFAAGLIRAFRAELAPIACADAIVSAPGSDEPAEALRDPLRGLALAAGLHRLVRNPPVLEPPIDRERFRDFFQGTLKDWILEQAHLVHTLAARGAKLEGYGQGLAAIEAGLADMRFVEVVRYAPVPDFISSDAELRDVYYGSLDQALEPRKAQGRDAALVGLRVFAAEGILHDARVVRARTLLSHLYRGRRIDALDGLPIDPPTPPHPTSVEQRLAAHLPTFYVNLVLGDVDATQPALLGALLQQGVPSFLTPQWRPDQLDPETRFLLAWARFRSGQLYWRASDFAAAAALLDAPLPGPHAAEAELIAATSRALARGPADAVAMMRSGQPEGVDVSELESLAARPGPNQGRAGFTAAYLLQLSPPTNTPRDFWSELERRFQEAAAHLESPLRERALDAAAAAGATARAVR